MNLLATLNLLAQTRQNQAGEEAAVVAMLMAIFGSIILVWVCIIAFYIIAIAIGIASTAFWIWMLIDCIQFEQKIPEPENQM